MAVTGDAGGFVISGIPSDSSYSVYCMHSDYIIGKSSPVTVKPGDTVGMGTIVLSYDPNKPVPTPRLVTAAFDTLHGVVNISWRSVHVPDLAGYVLKRGLDGSEITGLDTVALSDTVIHDTLYRSFTDLTPHTCRYEVQAFDSAPNYGGLSNPVTVGTVSPSLVRTVFGFSPVQTGDTLEAGDTVRISASFANNNNLNRTISWYDAHPGAAVALKQDTVDARSGNDTLSHVFGRAGDATLYIEALDDHDTVWTDSVTVFVRPRHVDAVWADSTTAGVAVSWQQSQQSGFAAYNLYCRLAKTDSLLYASIARTDTAHTVPVTKNGVFQYYVTVQDSQQHVSVPGKSVSAWIKNTPPQFTNDTAAVPKTTSVGKLYQVRLVIADVNKDSLTFKQLGLLGLTISDTTLTWTPTIQDTGSRHVAIQVSDGFGGYDTIQWNVKVMPVGVCAYGDSMPTPRFSLSAAVQNGVVYVAGGAKLFNNGVKLVPISLSNVESFPLSGGTTWSKKAPLVSARYDLGLASCGNRLFSFGGTKDGANNFTSIDSFSAGGGAWDTVDTLPAPLVGCAVCAIGDKVYCLGGVEKISGEDVVSDKIYEFDAGTGQCTFQNYMSTRRAYHQTAVVNGKIYVLGGLGGAMSKSDCVALGSVEVYNPQTNMIEPDTVSPLLTPRYYFGATEANGKLYAIGGYASASLDTTLSSIEEYDPSLNTWTVTSDLPAARRCCAAVSWQGRVYVVGGIVAGKATSSVVIYYP
jgi:hypothetical protein